ncbi:hypothetical protein ACS0TY_004894 [Phlomoides rotata]
MESSVAPKSKKIKLQNGEEIPFLPEDFIVEEILPRLPVKSLLRFRCVARSWCSLIESQRFMKIHLRYSIENASLALHRIIFNSIDGLKQCSLPSLFNDPFTNSITCNVDLGINFQRPMESVYLVGSCNGLVCILLDRRRFVLWNPTTRMLKNLPPFDNKMRHGSITKYGFGFDELNDDYRVFGLLSVFCVSGAYFPIRKVYSLRANSWKVVEGKDASPFDEKGFHVSGKLHWNIRYAQKCGIASFDLNTMVCGVVELPFFTELSHKLGVGVLKGCLSVHYYHRKTHVNIWLMKEYGVRDSWEKVVTVPYYHDPRENPLPTPFAIGPNGEVLLHNGDTFIIYNPKSNVFRLPQIIEHARFLNLDNYIESLAPIVPYAGLYKPSE